MSIYHMDVHASVCDYLLARGTMHTGGHVALLSLFQIFLKTKQLK